jgi:hypothetical protein
MESPSSPDYLSCEETEQSIPSTSAGLKATTVDLSCLNNIFKKRGSFLPKEVSIDYYLKNSIEHVNFNSDLTIVAFPGCIRIGKLFANKHLNETEFGLNKNHLIEIPIFLFNKFLKDLQNSLTFMFNSNINIRHKEKIIGETSHQIFLYCNKETIDGNRLILYQNKKNNNVVFEIKFESYKLLKTFSRDLASIILETTNPKPFLHVITLSFIDKLHSKPDNIVESLFDYWNKNQQLEILWNGISEVVYEIENKENDQLTNLAFNFVKRNIELIQDVKSFLKKDNVSKNVNENNVKKRKLIVK